MNAIHEARARRVQMHDLVGIDRAGELCSCGESASSWLEHLGLVAMDVMGASLPRVPKSAAGLPSDPLTVTRRILAERQARNDDLLRRLDESGVVGFNERMAWLAAERTAEEQQAVNLRWAALLERAGRAWRLPSVVDRVEQLHAQNLSDGEIAAVIGVSSSQVQRYRDRLGLESVGQAGRPRAAA